MKEALKIILVSIALAILYGILHDLVTAHICVEYFSIVHPKIITSNSPVALAFVWGVLATWWVGLLLGVSFVIAARSGKRRKVGLAQVLRSLIRLMITMVVVASISGAIGYYCSVAGFIYLLEPVASLVPEEKHDLILLCGWAHGASYLTGLVGGLLVCLKIWKGRAINREEVSE